MKTVYRYIKFKKFSDDSQIWSCLNHSNIELGYVEYYTEWRQFVFIPFSNTEYSFECLNDIADFLKQLNQ